MTKNIVYLDRVRNYICSSVEEEGRSEDEKEWVGVGVWVWGAVEREEWGVWGAAKREGWDTEDVLMSAKSWKYQIYPSCCSIWLSISALERKVLVNPNHPFRAKRFRTVGYMLGFKNCYSLLYRLFVSKLKTKNMRREDCDFILELFHTSF